MYDLWRSTRGRGPRRVPLRSMNSISMFLGIQNRFLTKGLPSRIVDLGLVALGDCQELGRGVPDRVDRSLIVPVNHPARFACRTTWLIGEYSQTSWLSHISSAMSAEALHLQKTCLPHQTSFWVRTVRVRYTRAWWARPTLPINVTLTYLTEDLLLHIHYSHNSLSLSKFLSPLFLL